MTRVRDAIQGLEKARRQVLACFKDGPLRTGDLLERLGYSGMNFVLTKYIGDSAGEWDHSPHQLAQSDLIDEGKLIWWRDKSFDVWYGLPKHCPYKTHGDESPICRRATAYLDRVCSLAGAVPRYNEDGNDSGEKGGLMWSAPFMTVREIESHDCCVSLSLEFPNGKGLVELSEYDFVVGAGNDEPVFKFPWPATSANDVADKVPDALKTIRKRWSKS